MRFWIPIFLTGLAMGALETSLVTTPGLWISLLADLGYPYYPSQTVSALNFAPFLVDPVGIFLILFLVGRRFDLSVGYARALASVLAGTLAGSFGLFAIVAVYATMIGELQAVEFVLEEEPIFIALGALRMAFVGFTGLALAHFARSRGFTPESAAA